VFGARDLEARFPIMCDFDGEARFAQAFGQESSRLVLVLDYQNAHVAKLQVVEG
jgi:hypothetical protein